MRTVLFAHGDPTACSGWLDDMGAVLRPAGLTLLEARTSPEAVSWVERGGLVGAVLVGDRTRIDGLTLLRIIRSIDGTLPCWLVTDAPTRSTLETALSLGATCVMSRPPTPNEFALAVQRLVN